MQFHQLVVTLTFPDVPKPITAVIVVAFTTVNDDAGVPPKATPVTPVKFVTGNSNGSAKILVAGSKR